MSNEEKSFPKTSINWYPGHMEKTKRKIREMIKLIDVVYELIDARIPYSSKNPMITSILKNKPHIIILTKSAMANKEMTKKWINYYQSQNSNVIAIDSLTMENVKKIETITLSVLQEKIERDKSRGLKKRAVRAMIVGIPNVGKSTLINKLVNKNVTITGNKPGVTKAQQWIRINQNLELLDTPGVLWPKFEDPKVGIHLALTGAIKNEILHNDDLILYLLTFLKENYKGLLNQRFSIDEESDNISILNDIMVKRGIQKEDYDRCYELIMNEFRSCKIGKITLDLI